VISYWKPEKSCSESAIWEAAFIGVNLVDTKGTPTIPTTWFSEFLGNVVIRLL
jgi:hypothetical protein